jgi:hypothetical protein
LCDALDAIGGLASESSAVLADFLVVINLPDRFQNLRASDRRSALSRRINARDSLAFQHYGLNFGALQLLFRPL